MPPISIGIGITLALCGGGGAGGGIPANVLRNASGDPILNASGDYIYYLN